MEFIFNIAVCDDEPVFLEGLCNTVSAIMERGGFKYNLKKLYNGKELLSFCRKQSADIIITDIDMPEIDGFKAIEDLQKSRTDLAVIFVTAHNEYAYQAYDYHPYQFVNKNDLEKLDIVIVGLAKKILNRKKYNEIVHVFLHGIIDINVNDVMYIKNTKNYVVAYHTDGTITKYRASLREIYEQLAEAGFIYAQRSYVLNCRFIDDFSLKTITMKNGEKISVSRDEEIRTKAQKNYGRFMRNGAILHFV